MAGLRELRKRLKSVQTTGQLAGAMRTVASAKFARAGTALNAYRVYAAACENMQKRAGGLMKPEPPDKQPDARPYWIVFSGNRGLCGGFNTELLNFFFERYAETATPPAIVACGRMAESFFRERRVETVRAFAFSDIPTYVEAQTLSDYVSALYASGAASEVTFVYQRFVNTLTQIPTEKTLLPPPETDEADEEAAALLLPDAETVMKRLAAIGLGTAVYAIALEQAAGAQAATLMAMRAAFDNAATSAQELNTTINRRRQAEVTAGVIETASENA